jgi:hypothetical protein
MNAKLNAVDLTGQYSDLLEDMRAFGYEARSFEDFSPTEKHLLLRHDIDNCPLRALKMAEDEAAFGWSSIYFILPTSPFYNMLEMRNISYLRRIVELGHEVGLHLELERNVNLQDKCEREARIVEDIIQKEVKWVSFHRPTENADRVKFTDIRLENFHHTYEPAYFSDIGYCSDSRGKWRYGHPTAHPSVAEGHALQLLTHPVWWFEDNRQSPQETLKSFQKSRDLLIQADITENFKLD